VGVKPAHQRQGLARRLIDRCLAALKGEGIEKVHLWVKADNEPGLAYWKHLGWNKREDVFLMSVVTGENPNA
jgi:ribosomal protein S18 acetylase RimI-like enzyme